LSLHDTSKTRLYPQLAQLTAVRGRDRGVEPPKSGLADNDEYRASTCNLLHLGGQIAFAGRRVTVTLDRSGSPRVARALDQLLDELAA
jgi:hypothetical protein